MVVKPSRLGTKVLVELIHDSVKIYTSYGVVSFTDCNRWKLDLIDLMLEEKIESVEHCWLIILEHVFNLLVFRTVNITSQVITFAVQALKRGC